MSQTCDAAHDCFLYAAHRRALGGANAGALHVKLIQRLADGAKTRYGGAGIQM